MKSEKGITILEIMISLVIIGITSSIVMLSIKTYNQCISDEIKTKEYYEEVAKLYSILISSHYDMLTTNKELKVINNRYEVYENDELITWFESNVAKNYQYDLEYHFNYISEIKLMVEDNYLFVKFKGYLEENSIMMRW